MIGKYTYYKAVYEVDGRSHILFKAEFDGISSSEIQSAAAKDMEELGIEVNEEYEFSFNNRCFYVMIFYLSDAMRLLELSSSWTSLPDILVNAFSIINFFKSMCGKAYSDHMAVKNMIVSILNNYKIDTNPPMPEKHLDLNFKYHLSGMNFDMRRPRVEFDFFKTADHDECVEPFKEDLKKLGADLMSEYVTWEFPTDVIGMQIHTIVIYQLDLALKLIESSYTDLDKIKQDQEKVKKFFKFYDDMTE